MNQFLEIVKVVNDKVSGFVWGVNIPVTLLLILLTPLPPVAVYIACNLTELIKLVIAVLLVRSGSWCKNITETAKAE